MKDIQRLMIDRMVQSAQEAAPTNYMEQMARMMVTLHEMTHEEEAPKTEWG